MFNFEVISQVIQDAIFVKKSSSSYFEKTFLGEKNPKPCICQHCKY